MKTLFTSCKINFNYQLLRLLNEDELLFGDYYPEKFPSEKSSSFAHELLSFCLDYEIEKVFAVRAGELTPLTEAKVLFAEYEIEIVLPDLNEIFSIDNYKAQADNFQNLSSQLLSCGYPSKNLALGKADLKGDLILIDDEVSDFNQIWNKINSISFTQMGKLFNHANFELLNIYQLEGSLKEINVGLINGYSYFFDNVDQTLALMIDLILKQNNCKGFYQVYYINHQIIRLKNIAS